jgi:hypothetical protein
MPTATLKRALRKTDGSILGACKLLKVPHAVFYYEVMARPGLHEYAHERRAAELASRQKRYWAQLVKHQGSIAETARALDLATSTVSAAIEDWGWRTRVAGLRPAKLSDPEEKAAILALLRKHRGQTHRVFPAFGVSKNTLHSKMVKHGLVEEADALRADANLSGPRTSLPHGRVAERRKKLLKVIESCGWNLSRATQATGVAPATFYKNMRELKIVRPRRLNKQHRLHRLVDALRLFRGDIARVGRSLGVPNATVLVWCDEFDIEPRSFRR